VQGINDQNAKVGIKLTTDLSGLQGGIGISSQSCGCASNKIIWRHIREENVSVTTTSSAAHEVVRASGQYVQMSNAHLNVDDKTSGEYLWLDPNFKAGANDTELLVVPNKSSPLTRDAMNNFIPSSLDCAEDVKAFVVTFAQGTASLLCPLDWKWPTETAT
jgi:hypothetical protein